MMPRKKKPRSGRHTASVGGTSQGAFSGTSMGSLNQQADSESDSLQGEDASSPAPKAGETPKSDTAPTPAKGCPDQG